MGGGSFSGTFKWSIAVRALALLFVRYKCGTSDAGPGIYGEKGSLALSLDYAISKQTLWLCDMFGVDKYGNAFIRKLIHRVNPERRRAGPVRLFVNTRILTQENICIMLDETVLCSAQGLARLDSQLSDSLNEADGDFSGAHISSQADDHIVAKEKVLPLSEIKSGASSITLMEFSRVHSLPIEIRAYSFVPFYIGPLGAKDLGIEYGLPVIECGETKIFPFEDGFCVALHETVYPCNRIDHFLWQRRIRHLELLNPSSSLTLTLLSLQRSEDHILNFFQLPDSLSYVMSVHSINNSLRVATQQQICLMAEPSIIGITDDPLQEPVRKIGEVGDVANSEIEKISYGSVNYYITWANVMIETLIPHEPPSSIVLHTQIRLQKLWYKLHRFLEILSAFGADDVTPELGVVATLASAVRDLEREFKSFVAVRPTAATDSDAIKASFIRTSRLKDLYNSLMAEVEVFESRFLIQKKVVGVARDVVK